MRVSQRVGDRRGREWAIGSHASDQPAPSWWTDTATLNARAEQFEAWCARVLDHLPCMQTLTTAVLLPHRCARVLDHLPPAVALGPVGVRHLAKADRVWGLSLLEFAFAAEMKGATLSAPFGDVTTIQSNS